jgi:anti-sigma regulatory factor (Ser/Thr protein kinase)
MILSLASFAAPSDSKPERARRWLRSGGLLFGAWSIPAVCAMGMELLVDARVGRSETVVQLLGASALPWYIWAPATPLVKRIVRRFPLRRPKEIGHLAVHAVMAIGMTIAFVAAMNLMRRLMGLPVSNESIWQRAQGWSPFTMLAYAAVAAVAHAELYATRADTEALHRALLAEQLARAQLSTLRMQLHPHFLFNALHTIAMLVREQDSATAVRLITELGVILRELLHDPGAIEAPLGDELDLIGRYLGIERLRFGDRLAVTWRVDVALLDAAVPPLILQPLVENAVRHGIAHSTTVGEITIGAEVSKGQLVLTVCDTGPFAPPADACHHELDAPNAGVGLANTRTRLARMYGDGASLDLERTEGGWTVATVTLPLTRVLNYRRDVGGSVAAAASSAERWFIPTSVTQERETPR